MSLPIFIDIDGTLTSKDVRGGEPISNRIDTVRKWINQGKEIVLWSANGTEYAKQFAVQNNLTPMSCIGKPSKIIDDNPTVRPNFMQLIVSPKELD